MSLVLVAGCSTESNTPPPAAGENPTLTIKIGSSQPETQPNFYCGMKLLKERIEAQNLNLTIDLFPNSQLGPDAERFAGVQAGDIDIDLQGGSAMSTAFPKIGVLDAAYAFNDIDHFFKWIDTNGQDFFKDFNGATDTTIIDAWYFGMRTFTATAPIRKPEDLASLKIRFPNTPAVPRQRQGARRQRRRDRGRGAVPRAPAGRRPGPGEPGRGDPRAEVRRDPQGRQPDQPPGRHALRRHLGQDAGQDEPGPEGRAVQGRPATSGPRTASASTTRPRRCSTGGAPTPAAPWSRSTRSTARPSSRKAEAFFKTYYKGANLTLYESIRASA